MLTLRVLRLIFPQGNNLKMGIVGLPNVGKSLFFNVLCNMQVDSANFPFCTIDPNVSRVEVPDERYDDLCKNFKPKSCVPAYLSVTDIAGLVKGASEGAGLGNAFLSHIQAVDGIFHMLRAFDDPDVIHVDDEIDPVRDLDTIHGELIAKDLAAANKAWEDFETNAKKSTTKKDKAWEARKATLEKVKSSLEAGIDIRNVEWDGRDFPVINELPLITVKPVIYVANLSKKDFLRKKNKWLPKIKEWIDANGGGPLMPISAAFEKEYFDAEDKEAYLKECGEGIKTMLPKLVVTGYEHLKLIHYFTCGPDEVRCWTIRQGTLAPAAAGAVHSDFQLTFVKGEVYSYADYVEHGKTEAGVKAAGKFQLRGKTAVINDGDICHWKAGAAKGKK